MRLSKWPSQPEARRAGGVLLGRPSGSANKPYRDNRFVLYKRLPRLFAELAWRATTVAINAYCTISTASSFCSSITAVLSRSTLAPLARPFGSINGLPFTHR